MVDDIDRSLDEIIGRSTQFNYPSKRRRGRGRHSRRRADSPFPGRDGGTVRGRGVHKRKTYTDKVPSYPRGGGYFSRESDFSGNSFGQRPTMFAWKLLISNLDLNVNNEDINELFAEFGPLISSGVHYNDSGTSLGTAEAVFEHKANAVNSMKRYNGVPLDGRPMVIQLSALELPSNKKPAPRKGVPQRVTSTRRSRRRRSGALTSEKLDAELDAYRRQRRAQN